MAGFSTTFCATHEELREFFIAQIKEFQLHVFVERWDFRKLKYFTPVEVYEIFVLEKLSNVYFTKTGTSEKIQTTDDLVDNFDSILGFYYPDLGPVEYEFTSLSTRSDDKIWNKINRRLKKITKAGIYMCQEGAEPRYVNYYRYTKGAKNAFDRGAKFKLTPNSWATLPEFPE